MPSKNQKRAEHTQQNPGRNGRRTTKASGPHPIDLHVGRRFRELRMLKGMGQAEIATLIGTTFQQVQKYERGANRISASRLYDIAEALGVPVSYFFDLLPPDLTDTSIHERLETVTRSVVSREDPMQRRETLELVRSYYGIEDEILRSRIFELIKAASSYNMRKSEK
ncbi:helix-turn-helix transcriptional regulator [uncultured Sneathiella sp.]|jgi:transcriptional regulator with XRE-family HTH domain|uniref:helix-turn-helix domain-containing protein n=1 Tax=uncultured Sneathiella sp. TaxID=879315 RepID=UPI0030EF7DFB|tara:strand:+ start:52384 stop:52884 length:501 start_codon:yes stop_codon:yes gene_type:complete